MLSINMVTQALVAGLALSSTTLAGKTQSVKDWGDNPSGLPAMLVYIPDKLAEKPAVILGVRFPNSSFSSSDVKLLATSLRRNRPDVPANDSPEPIRR